MEDTVSLKKQALQRISEQNFSAAEEIYLRILKNNDNDSEALFYLGRIFELKGNMVQAMKLYFRFFNNCNDNFANIHRQAITLEQMRKIMHSRSSSCINSNIQGGTTISNMDSMVVNCQVGKNCSIYQAELTDVRLGDWSAVNSRTRIWNSIIGKFTSIGAQGEISISGHPTTFFSTHPLFYNKDSWNNGIQEELYNDGFKSEIGNDVWIGTNVIVKAGVKIGTGAIIGAKSYVNQDIPPYAIAYGTPAKVAKFRFDIDIIRNLLELCWWDFSDEKLKMLTRKINKNHKMLSDINLFLSEANIIKEM